MSEPEGRGARRLDVTTLAIGGPIARSDLPGITGRVCAQLEASGAATLLCDVAGVEADAVTIDALARLALAARRRECVVRLSGSSRGLRELVAFMGLDDVLVAP